MIRLKGSTLTLSWEPTWGGSDSLLEVAYAVFYRRLSDKWWTFLDQIPASGDIRYTVNHDRLGDGFFAFAVRSVSADGSYSEYHSSLDWSANPITGWYVFWQVDP